VLKEQVGGMLTNPEDDREQKLTSKGLPRKNQVQKGPVAKTII